MWAWASGERTNVTGSAAFKKLIVEGKYAEAAKMLRECVRLAREEQRVVVFLEPIALYPMRDLHADKDALHLFDVESGERLN